MMPGNTGRVVWRWAREGWRLTKGSAVKPVTLVGKWGSVPWGVLGRLMSSQGSPPPSSSLVEAAPHSYSSAFLACCMVAREASGSQRKPQAAGHRCFQLEVGTTWTEIESAKEMWGR